MHNSLELENNVLARENELLKAENARLKVRCTVLDACWNATLAELDKSDLAHESTLIDLQAQEIRADRLDHSLNAMEQGHDHYHGEAQLQKARADRLERVIVGMNNGLTEMINHVESDLMNDRVDRLDTI